MSDEIIIDDELKLRAIVAATATGMAEVFYRVLLDEETEEGWSAERLAGVLEQVWEKLAIPLIEESCVEEKVDPALLHQGSTFRDLFLTALGGGVELEDLLDPELSTSLNPTDQIVEELGRELAAELWPDFGTREHGIAGRNQRTWFVDGVTRAAFHWYGRARLAESFSDAGIITSPEMERDGFCAAFAEAFEARVSDAFAGSEEMLSSLGWRHIGPARLRGAGKPTEEEYSQLSSAVYRVVEWRDGAGASAINGGLTHWYDHGWDFSSSTDDLSGAVIAFVNTRDDLLAITDDGAVARLRGKAWEQLSPPIELAAVVEAVLAISTSPEAVAAYDTGGKQVILWRAIDYPELEHRTLSWKDESWREISRAAPMPPELDEAGPEVVFQLVYDTALDRVIRFGARATSPSSTGIPGSRIPPPPCSQPQTPSTAERSTIRRPAKPSSSTTAAAK